MSKNKNILKEIFQTKLKFLVVVLVILFKTKLFWYTKQQQIFEKCTFSERNKYKEYTSTTGAFS